MIPKTEREAAEVASGIGQKDVYDPGPVELAPVASDAHEAYEIDCRELKARAEKAEADVICLKSVLRQAEDVERNLVKRAREAHADLMRVLLARVEKMQPNNASEHWRCVNRLDRLEAYNPQAPLILKAPWELDMGPGFFRSYCSCGGYDRVIFLTGREVWMA